MLRAKEMKNEEIQRSRERNMRKDDGERAGEREK